MDFGKIEKMVEGFMSDGLNVYAVSAIINGEQRDYRLREDNNCKNTYSVSKAFTMNAVGMLFDEGLLDVNETMLDIFGDEYSFAAEPRWKTVTIDNALTHKTGITKNSLDIDADDVHEYGTEDYLEVVFANAIDGVTGETYCYSDAAYYLLSRIVSKKCGCSLCDYLLPRLFVPLGFREVAWSVCPKGYNIGATGLYIRCDDTVKIGTLWLNRGVLNGKRLISEKWIDIALKNGYAFTPLFEGKRGYQKTGAKGQKLYFSYDDNLALSVASFDNSSRVGDVMVKFI